MKAVILAGGKGTRLGPLTASLPKPLVMIGEKPVLEHQILLLKRYGLTDIIILTGHLGDQIAAYVGDGSRWGVSAICMQEQEPQGTAGALRMLSNDIAEDFLLLSGDVMVHFDVKRFVDAHFSKKDSVVTAMIRETSSPLHSDLVCVSETMRVTNMFLRPHPEGITQTNLGIASVYILSPRFFDFIPQEGKCDIEKDVFPCILQAGASLYGYHTKEYIRDMGTPDRLTRVRADYEQGLLFKTT